MSKFSKVFPIIKVDIAQRLVYGLVTAERVDKDGEICHYESTVPFYKAINEEMGKATDGENIMPLREMHQLHAVGKGKSIEFDDAAKQIRMAFKVVEDSTWNKVLEKVLTGFSQGGSYVKRWTENKKTYYTADPSEVSLVDNPCLAGAVIEYVKADGTVEKYSVPEPSLVRLSDADIERLVKALGDSILGTSAEKLDAALAELMRQRNPAKGEEMNKEQIAKCAAALGITPEEFIKLYVEGDALEKGKKGLAALGHHLHKAHSHHSKMHDLHKTMSDHHKTMADHLENCMKAHGACMDGDEADKVLKSLLPVADEMVSIGKTADGVEVFRKKADKEVKLDELTKADGMKAEDVQKLINAALEKQAKEFNEKLDKSMAPNNGGTNGARLVLLDREGKEIAKADGADARNPMAVS